LSYSAGADEHAGSFALSPSIETQYAKQFFADAGSGATLPNSPMAMMQ
jgi:hypothetical protein